MNYYYDEKNIIRVELLTTLARKGADDFRNERLNPSQLRRFYNHFKNLYLACGQQGENFDRKLPLVKMALSQAAYAKSRRNIKQNFYEFLEKNLNNIESYQDFSAFILHFEAIVGYYGERG